MRIKSLVKCIPFILFSIILILPSHVFMMPGLSILEQRVIAIFILAASCWILETLPIFATSVMIIFLELILLSDKGFSLFFLSHHTETFGKVLPANRIFATFADPIIILFLGGFSLAIAATKFRLDINLARVLLKPFGTHPKAIILGLMVITALFSMFMSNTATTAMMLTIMGPLLVNLEYDDPSRVAFVLAIPIAASIGGVGTPIASPPNAVAMSYLSEFMSLSFGQWMIFGVPFVMILLIIAWWIICFLYPAKNKTVVIEINGKFLKTRQAYLVYSTFFMTILLWMMGDFHGMNASVVALLPLTIFLAFKIITKEDLKDISWDVLWLVSGGIALGLALEQTGLAARLVSSIPFAKFTPLMILVGIMLMTIVMATFMSHTATANLLLPITAALASNLSSLHEIGGAFALIIAVAFTASLGMALPISTPPNALAMSSGMIATKDLAKVGICVGSVGFIMVMMMLWLLKVLGWSS